MNFYTVHTTKGIYRHVEAYSAGGAMKKIFALTFGREEVLSATRE